MYEEFMYEEFMYEEFMYEEFMYEEFMYEEFMYEEFMYEEFNNTISGASRFYTKARSISNNFQSKAAPQVINTSSCNLQIW